MRGCFKKARRQHKHYTCPAGYGPQGTSCVASSKLSTAAQSTRYFQHDHLGSIVVITDEAGVVTERLAYDPWGKRRNASGTSDNTDSLVSLTTDRGYTEHEHLDEVGVIHMNGRIFDPYIGRFMSADPFIQAPFELQSHNRYAYVMNNPLAFTDPSGYFSLRGFISYAVFGIGAEIPVVRQITVIGACVLGGPIACGAATAANVYASGGTPAQAAKAGVIAWGTAEAFEWAGTTGTGAGVTEQEAAKSLTRYAAHASVGCVSSVAGGGQCGTGAAAAVLGKWVTNSTSNWGAGIAQGTAAAVAGGVGSVIAGGKFENGARTAAFGYLFNQASRLLRGAGHHKVTNEIARKYNWSGEALEVFDSLHGDGGGRIPVQGHNFGDGHSAYNRDAKDFVEKHLESTKIEPNKMTTNEAKAMIKSMDTEPKLRNFNVRVYVNGVIKSMRMTTPKGAND